MKELSIEEKAKAYDEAYKVAKNIHIFSSDLAEIKRMEEIFPELKEESEDERIKKRICKLLWDNAPYEEAQEYIAWLEKQGKKTSDKIIEKARTEKQRVLLTETDGSANIDWDCRSLDDVKVLLKCGLEFIRTIEANKQILTDNRFGGCSFRVPTRYDKDIKQGEQMPVIEMKTVSESLGFTTQKECDDYNKMVTDIIMSDDGKGEQKPANKVEPQFHEGDWVVVDGVTQQITQIRPEGFDTDRAWNGKLTFKDVHLWTIQDAKPGNVLVDQNGGMPFIFKECKNNHIYCYCGYTNRKDIFFDRFVDSEGEELHWLNLYHEQAYPATKEQRDLLFQKMKEAGYEWDANKKELKEIKQLTTFEEAVKDLMNDYRDAIGDNDATTEEVKKHSEYLLSLIPQKPAWSKEDEVKINRIVACLENLNVADNDILLKDVDWLKSLRQQNRWKPSESQLEALDDFIYAKYPNIEKYEASVKSLYQDLKKLKG